MVVRIQGKMSRVEQMDLGVWYIALVRLGAGRQKENVVLAPNREHGRAVLAQIGLEVGVERDVGALAQDQIELDFLCLPAMHVERIEQIAVRRHRAGW